MFEKNPRLAECGSVAKNGGIFEVLPTRTIYYKNGEVSEVLKKN